ncbi:MULTISPECIES: helix-turn-helix domain-containing protein [Gordonia]|jgi:DNA-binding IclR family transcriptional regulator|uniref:helix-turn-helix domain-containing protein n=1 Tax=Gordonia oleivorans TaxID=3156618 RepID=UPI0032B4C4C1
MSPAFAGDSSSRSVINALQILEEVATIGPGVSAAELSRHLGLSKSAIYRLVNLLAQEEYLVRTPDLGGFALGAKIERLVGVASGSTVPEQLRTTLDELRGGLRFGVHLFGCHRPGTARARLSLIDIDPDYPLSDPGRLLHDLTASAAGRLVLAVGSGHPSAAPEFVSQVGSFIHNFGCVAVPVWGRDDELSAVLVISAPAKHIDNADALARLLSEPAARVGAILRAEG